jgi:polyisoprenoid-binding protein YceI
MLPRRALLAVTLAAGTASAQAPLRYAFDEAAGRVGFSARHLGFVRSHGEFRRFRATLLLDPARPTEAEVEGVVEAASAHVPFPGADELLRSEAFFDAARFPEARFRGRATGAGEARAFPVAGELTIRGATRPFAMQARLVGREREAGGAEVASFEAAGTLRRGEFGMVAERVLISDDIALTVAVRIRLS